MRKRVAVHGASSSKKGKNRDAEKKKPGKKKTLYLQIFSRK